MYHFYDVHNAFISSKKLILGPHTSILSLEGTSFFNKRGSFEEIHHFNIIRIYCSHKKPSYLSYYVSDNMFLVEVCKQYRFWSHFFHEKRKNKFIPLPWKIWEIMLKNTAKLMNFSVHFDQFDLKKENEIKGFDHNQSFMKQITLIGYNVSFSNTFLFGEEDDDSKNP